MQIERVPTGIPGLDELVEGGFPKDTVTLVAGSIGTGKTIFALQFLVHGALKGERGLYITFEETKHLIKEQATRFNWDLDDLEGKHLLRVVSLLTSHTNIQKVLFEIDELVRKFEPQRLVLDSLTTLQVYTDVLVNSKTMEQMGVSEKTYESVTRKAVVDIVERVRGYGVTTILTSELPEGSPWYSRDSVSEFVCDGAIKLSKVETIGKRSLTIGKMRATNHDVFPKKLTIGEKGLVVSNG